MTKYNSIQHHLRNSIFLNTASDEVIHDLSKSVELINIKAGEQIFEKGELGSAIYFIIVGTIQVHDGDMVIAERSEGDAFGEIGALASLPRTASVTATSESQLIKLDKQAIYDTMLRQPDAARSIIEAICHRESTIINDSIEQAIKSRITERELAIAQRIQGSFLPDDAPDVPGWSIAGYLKPARDVAGDFYDFFKIPGSDFIGLVIGDVCDKGVGAALFMTLFSSLIRSSSTYREFEGDNQQFDDMAGIIRHSIKLTNDYIATTHAKSSMFASIFYGILNPHTGQLAYINAGHESPVIVNVDGIVNELESSGPVIGLFTEIEHEVNVITIQPDEMLVAYTDGATDAKNRFGDQLSEEKLLELITGDVLPACTIIQKLVNYLDEYIGSADQYDDITIIVASRVAV